jgi:hypothetical protein
LFVFEHDSDDAWIWKLEVIRLLEEAGEKVLGEWLWRR